MKKRQAEALAASKPVFLTKKQREELALKKRQDEVAARQGLPRPGVGAAPSGAAANGVGASHEVPRRTEREAQDHRRDDDKRQRDEVLDSLVPLLCSRMKSSARCISCIQAFIIMTTTCVVENNRFAYLSSEVVATPRVWVGPVD